MSTIRRQSIVSSLFIYFGFLVGLFNTYLFIEHFKTNQYGLTTVFINIAMLMMTTAMFATPSYIAKFYPYYKDHLPEKKNDMITISLVACCIGFALVTLAGLLFRDLVVRKFGANSPDLVTYYYWTFPMGFGLTIYMLFESYAWNLGKSSLTNFLREAMWRILVTILIGLYIFGVIPSFGSFIKLFSLTYAGIAIILITYLCWTKRVHFTFSISKVTRRYARKILMLCGLIYSSSLVFIVYQVLDTLVIAAVLDDGLAKAGIFSLAAILGSVILAPYRAVIAASIPALARAWKDKDRGRLLRIYQRSASNLLVISLGLFLLIALNYNQAIVTFGLKAEYLLGFNAFLFLGLTRVVDMGTGVNSELLGTSSQWRFIFISGVILLLLMIPLTYVFAKQFDLVGPAVANLVTISIYNLVRILYIWKKFRLQPFVKENAYTIMAAAAATIVAWYVGTMVPGFAGLAVRSLIFCVIFGGIVWRFNLAPDLQSVANAVLGKIRRK